MKRLLAPLLLSLLAAGLPAQACMVHNMTYEQALAQTDTTVLAEIVELLPTREGQLARSFNYRVRLVGSERGALKVGTLIDLELLVHLVVNVNGTIRCPFQRGSGMESEFKAGGRYRMLIKREGDTYELFWSEGEQVAHGAPDAG